MSRTPYTFCNAKEAAAALRTLSSAASPASRPAFPAGVLSQEFLFACQPAQELMTADEFALGEAKRPESHWELFDGVPQIQQAES
jgi:hypothetical protein